MLKKWIKILAVISIIAIIGSAIIANLGSDQSAGTINITIDYKDGLWKQIEAIKDDSSLVIGTLFLPDPAVIQVVSDSTSGTYYLQVKNLKSEKTLISVRVTQNTIDSVLQTITDAANNFKENSTSTEETGQNQELFASIKEAVSSITK